MYDIMNTNFYNWIKNKIGENKAIEYSKSLSNALNNIELHNNEEVLELLLSVDNTVVLKSKKIGKTTLQDGLKNLANELFDNVKTKAEVSNYNNETIDISKNAKNKNINNVQYNNKNIEFTDNDIIVLLALRIMGYHWIAKDNKRDYDVDTQIHAFEIAPKKYSIDEKWTTIEDIVKPNFNVIAVCYDFPILSWSDNYPVSIDLILNELNEVIKKIINANVNTIFATIVLKAFEIMGLKWIAVDKFEDENNYTIHAFKVKPYKNEKEGFWCTWDYGDYRGNPNYKYMPIHFEYELRFLKWSNKAPTSIKTAIDKILER